MLRISEEEIGSDAPFQPARYRLLQAALRNYEELRAAGHDDPKVREELDRMLDRVRGLLDQQAAAREAEGAFLLAIPDVREELDLSDDQRERIDRVFGRKDPPPFRGPGKGPPPDVFRLADPETRQELLRVLTGPQRGRLRQLFLQSRGPFAFAEPEVVDELRLTPEQRQQIKMIQTEAFPWFGPGPGKFGRPGPPKGPGGPPDGRPGPPGGPRGPDPEAMARAMAQVMEKILAALDPEQRAKWQALVGKPSGLFFFRGP
jgi:hypothetical protein